MKSTTLLLGSVLASAAIAQPHQHNAKHLHIKRAQSVVWATDWVTVIETVGFTTTFWVSDGFVPPTPSLVPSSSTTSTSSAEIPAQFFEGGDQSAATSSSSSVYTPPVPTSTYVPPAAPSKAPAYVAPAPAPAPAASSSSEAEVYSAPTPAYTPPAQTTTSPAPAAPSSSSSSSGSSTGVCSSSSPCEGDITFYTAGLGACGLTTDGTVEKVVALPHELMGPLSNDNPYCGKTITITCIATGQTTTATVVDKCMGCSGYAIDLSTAAFDELDSEAVGRTGATWFFN